MIKNFSFLKIFSIFLGILFGFLGFWQYSRFEYKKQYFSEIENLKSEITGSKHIILNSKILEEIKSSKKKIFFKKIIACGDLKYDNSFILEKISSNNLKLKEYKIIFEIQNKNFSSESILFIKSEIFDKKQDAIKKIKELQEEKSQYSCLSGLIQKIPEKNYSNLIQRISNFNGFNFLKKTNNSYNSKVKVINQVSKKELEKFDFKNDFFIDSDYSKLDSIKINQNHHIFYMIMWICLAIYMFYFGFFQKKKKF